jgi:hypothetical protein
MRGTFGRNQLALRDLMADGAERRHGEIMHALGVPANYMTQLIDRGMANGIIERVARGIYRGVGA